MKPIIIKYSEEENKMNIQLPKGMHPLVGVRLLAQAIDLIVQGGQKEEPESTEEETQS